MVNLQVFCEMDTRDKIRVALDPDAKPAHPGERVEMICLCEPFWCPSCGYEVDSWEIAFEFPRPYGEMDGVQQALLDFRPVVICSPDGFKFEFPRR